MARIYHIIQYTYEENSGYVTPDAVPVAVLYDSGSAIKLKTALMEMRDRVFPFNEFGHPHDNYERPYYSIKEVFVRDDLSAEKVVEIVNEQERVLRLYYRKPVAEPGES